ncbi:unnamed protein product [Lymnaea stagnalis]|uniref:C-type lectin domain-containing protein n=1 Tax=Lymnaea stagnalis TaxID=6523 RepID=A0AAV2H6K4_LYMST
MLEKALKALITASILVKVTAQVLEVEPKILLPSTKSLVVNCSLPHASFPRLASLISLIISRGNAERGVTKYESLAVINAVTGNILVQSGQAAGNGVINNKGDSFISLSFKYPTAAMSGDYSCEANGMDLSWRPITLMKTSKVPSVNFTVDMLAEQLRNLNIKFDEKSKEFQSNLENSNQSLSEFIDDWKRRIEESRRWFFKISNVYQGRRYYLSQQDPITRSESAMATCVMYGGYLAEIDDVGERDFVKRFIRELSGFRLVLIGGTDEAQEEVWVYRHSKKLVPSWLVKSRRYGNLRNCLFLYDIDGWDAIDEACYYTTPSYITRFLCEIPDVK